MERADSTTDGCVEISCADCVRSRHGRPVREPGSACEDCIVTFVTGPGAVVFDLDEFRAIRRLQAAGLVPENRHDPATERAMGDMGP